MLHFDLSLRPDIEKNLNKYALKQWMSIPIYQRKDLVKDDWLRDTKENVMFKTCLVMEKVLKSVRDFEIESPDALNELDFIIKLPKLGADKMENLEAFDAKKALRIAQWILLDINVNLVKDDKTVLSEESDVEIINLARLDIEPDEKIFRLMLSSQNVYSDESASEGGVLKPTFISAEEIKNSATQLLNDHKVVAQAPIPTRSDLPRAPTTYAVPSDLFELPRAPTTYAVPSDLFELPRAPTTYAVPSDLFELPKGPRTFIPSNAFDYLPRTPTTYAVSSNLRR